MARLRTIHVFDLDGVLVDSSHRYRNLPNGAIDLDYWLANRTAENIAKDKLLPFAKKYRRDVAADHIYTVICTARQDMPEDVDYIVSHLGAPDKLIMRRAGDNTPDGQLKRRELARLFNLRQFSHLPRFFWDDNPKNLAACFDLFTRVFHIQSNQGA